MKIWSDSLSHHNSIHDGYVSPVENFLSGEYNGDSHLPGAYAFSYDTEYVPPPSPEPDDCADVRPYYNAQTHSPLDQEQLSRLTEHRLQLASTLHMQACDASHWLICNPVETGKIAVIDEEAFSFLENFRVPTTLPEITATSDAPITRLLAIVSIFINLYFLCDLDEAPVASSKQSGASTLSAWLHITNACNLRCHYCYVSKSSDHMEQETSRRAIDAVIRSAGRYRYMGVHLKYAGGEAALQLPQVIATYDYAQQQAQEHHLRLSASLLSNGTIMTQRMIE